MVAIVDPIHQFRQRRSAAGSRDEPPVGWRGKRRLDHPCAFSPLDFPIQAKTGEGRAYAGEYPGRMAHRQFALHQIELEISHASDAAKLAADKSFLGWAVHLRNKQDRRLLARIGVAPRVHADRRQRCFDRGFRRQ